MRRRAAPLQEDALAGTCDETEKGSSGTSEQAPRAIERCGRQPSAIEVATQHCVRRLANVSLRLRSRAESRQCALAQVCALEAS